MNNGIIIHIFKIFYCFWFAPLVIAEILENIKADLRPILGVHNNSSRVYNNSM